MIFVYVNILCNKFYGCLAGVGGAARPAPSAIVRAVGPSSAVPEVLPASVPVLRGDARRESPAPVPTSFECLSGWSCLSFTDVCVRDILLFCFLIY